MFLLTTLSSFIINIITENNNYIPYIRLATTIYKLLYIRSKFTHRNYHNKKTNQLDTSFLISHSDRKFQLIFYLNT